MPWGGRLDWEVVCLALLLELPRQIQSFARSDLRSIGGIIALLEIIRTTLIRSSVRSFPLKTTPRDIFDCRCNMKVSPPCRNSAQSGSSRGLVTDCECGVQPTCICIARSGSSWGNLERGALSLSVIMVFNLISLFGQDHRHILRPARTLSFPVLCFRLGSAPPVEGREHWLPV